MLDTNQLGQLQSMIADAGVDGWLLFDFRGINPVATSLLGVEGMVTRRWFCYVPRDGEPVAITHGIEQGVWRDWPSAWPRRVYSSWRQLESELASVVGGKRVAMEYSRGDAVPYLDRVPAGVIEMVRDAGATVESSADLVTRFYALFLQIKEAQPSVLEPFTAPTEYAAQGQRVVEGQRLAPAAQ